MSKKTFSTAPKPKTQQPSPEVITAFELGGAGHDKARVKSARPVHVEVPDPELTKRLSLDLPQRIHTRFKTACSATDRKMISEVLQLIEARTAELEKLAGITHK